MNITLFKFLPTNLSKIVQHMAHTLILLAVQPILSMHTGIIDILCFLDTTVGYLDTYLSHA